MGFFKNLMLRQMLKSQLKDVPKEQQEKVIAAIEKNPQFFENIAKKVDQKMKEGKDQMAATMEVMRENQEELKKMMM